MGTNTVRGIRDAIKSLVPNWLADRLKRNNAFKWLYAIALVADQEVEVMLEGVRAAFPGKGTDTALPYIGQSRGIIQGLNELNSNYAARLRAWLQLWPNAGSSEILAQLIQGYLTLADGTRPVVRVVDRRGQFVTANADGTTTKTTDAAWNWDSAFGRGITGQWSDIWIIIYQDVWPVYSNFSDPNWVNAWGKQDGNAGVGHVVPRGPVNGLLQILASFKGAHTWIQAVIFSTDTTLFVPGSLGGIPDGTWNGFSAPIGSTQSQRRFTKTSGGTIRYWIPTYGG